jgi:hypothetical protein
MAEAGKAKKQRGDYGGASVLVAGQGPLALPLVRFLATAGISNFILLSLADHSHPRETDDLIQAIRTHGQAASIHLVQVAGLDSQENLFPQNLDLVLDAMGPQEDHQALESACRAQGIPLVLAFASDSLFLTGLLDPYAGSMARLFGEKGIFREGSSGNICGGEIDDAGRAAGQLALELLSGRASFWGSQLQVHDRVTCLSSQVPMPVKIPVYPRMVLIGADQRKLGKTSLCIQLAQRLSGRGQPVRVLKIDNQGSEGQTRLIRESLDEGKASIQALFEAGSQEVWRLLARENELAGALPDALAQIYETMDQKGVLLCESNSARRFLQPGLFIHLMSPHGQVKASAVRTRRLADRLLVSPFTKEDVDLLMERITE